MRMDVSVFNLNSKLRDGGPVYSETSLGNLIVEPWNAFSSLVFIIPVIYFLYKLIGSYKEYSFVVYWCLPLLFIGGIGSTLYHAFRISRFFLFLDMGALGLLTLSICYYFWMKVLSKWYLSVTIILITVIIRGLVFRFFQGQSAINISYLISGFAIIIPAFILTSRTKFYKYHLLIITVIMMTLAILLRYFDDMEITFMPMGTHWLWHIFSTVGIFTLFYYFIKIDDLVSPKIDI